ncbi:MAG: family 1 glycosylhydrolase [Gemmatimonadaceae bacterium]|nr:family 1 glycosylhydrolase [Gemmatimonadaceae bacterium]
MTDPHALLAARFPADFRFGVATSAYQIEGSLDADGRGPSIWDTFASRANAIERGETAAIACDHYRRWRDDIELIASLGVDSYRFSIAWPRIQPTGRGPVNEAGLAFYDRLVDGLLAKGIRPFPTLYHWDLPQALEDEGGWATRDTAERYAEYAALVADRLGDRVGEWSLFNEPYIFTSRGYLLGRYAPGKRSLRGFLRSVHTVVRAHALGYRAIKAVQPHLKVGSVFAMAPVEPATTSDADIEAARYGDALFNRIFIDPLMQGAYPQAFLDGVPIRALDIQEGDMAAIHTPLDFIGVNCYYRLIISAGEQLPDDLPLLFFGIRADTRGTGGHADFTVTQDTVTSLLSAFGRSEGERTEMGWEIWPRALHDVLVSLNIQYPGLPLHVCESGCAFADKPGDDGIVHDESRIAYHRAHLSSVADAIGAGANVRSYHAWSLYDNFEWASGYRPRFGIVHVDYKSQRRTLKQSAEWYREMIRAAAATRTMVITRSPADRPAYR